MVLVVVCGVWWWGSVIKRMRGGEGIPVHCTTLHRHCYCPPAHCLAQLVITCCCHCGGNGGGCWWLLGGGWWWVGGVGGGMSWWWWVKLVGWSNEPNMWSSLGDMPHHVINVGTCCPNLQDCMWAGCSAVKHTLLWLKVAGCLNQQKNIYFFLHQIKLNWILSGVLLDYMWSPARVVKDWIRSPGEVSILMDSIRSLFGVYLESARILWWCKMAVTLGEVQMDSRKTPDGVHQEVWLSVRPS